MAIKLKIKLDNLGKSEMIRFHNQIRKLDQEKSYKIYFADDIKMRSPSQNRYYWGVLLHTMEQETGYDPNELHEMLKAKFNLKTVELATGEIISFGSSTKVMDKKEFTRYIDNIREWAQHGLGIHIPLPNELPDEYYESFIKQNLI